MSSKCEIAYRACISRRLLQFGGSGKDPAANALGKEGGAARAAKMTPERGADIARKAAEKRRKTNDSVG